MPNATGPDPRPATGCGNRDIEDFMALEAWVERLKRTPAPGLPRRRHEETVDLYWLASAPQTPCVPQS